MKNFLSFFDLDNTIIQTDRHVKDLESTLVYTNKGKSLVTTSAQLSLFQLFNTNGYFIPVTARSLEQLEKMKETFDFKHHKICNHGVFIYDENDQLVENYTDGLIKFVSFSQDNFHRVSNYIAKLFNVVLNADVCYKSVVYKQYTMYIEGRVSTLEELQFIQDYVESLGLVFTNNAKSFAIFSQPDNFKKDACDYLKSLSKYESLPTVGAGDSDTDIPFMESQDFMIIPNLKSTQISLS